MVFVCLFFSNSPLLCEEGILFHPCTGELQILLPGAKYSTSGVTRVEDEPFCRLVEGLLPLLLQGCHLLTVSHVIFKWNMEVSLSPESHHIELMYFFSLRCSLEELLCQIIKSLQRY